MRISKRANLMSYTFQDITQCRQFLKSFDVSEKHIASIFRVDE
jgi:hypothetical protein